jgi:hypothetical protein
MSPDRAVVAAGIGEGKHGLRSTNARTKPFAEIHQIDAMHGLNLPVRQHIPPAHPSLRQASS